MIPATGPPPVANPPQPAEAALTLRLNQRLIAEVLQVAADHVVLALEGVRVVARLTSPEQAAVLAEHQTAQFIVRDFAEQTLTLQLANPAPTPPAPAPTAGSPDLVSALLEQNGLPVNESNTRIAQALVANGLPVTPELVGELASALGDVPGWGQAEAQTAAALKAAGLPLTGGSIALANAEPAPLPGLRSQLIARIESLLQLPAAEGLPPRLTQLARGALETLRQMGVEWADAPTDIAGQLRAATVVLGRSVEHELAALTERGQSPRDLASGPGLLSLAQLRGEVESAQRAARAAPSLRELAAGLDRFLDSTRLMHLVNVAPDRALAGGHWLSLNLPLGNGAGQPHAGATAHLRVAYRPGGESDAVDPAYTRLVIQVELEGEQALAVDLSVVERQISARVTASSAELRERAEAEMPELDAGLRHLGFEMKTARYETGPTVRMDWPAIKLPLSSASMLRPINVEV